MHADKLNIAISGLLATDNPHPGLGIARCLCLVEDIRDNASLTGLVFDPLSTGAFDDDLFDRIYMAPYPAAGHEALMNRLEEIHETCPIDVIIPALDSEVLLYARCQDQLAELGIKLLLPSESQVKLRGKNLLYEFGSHNGIRVPQTLILNNQEEIKPKSAQIGIPFVLKSVLSDARICGSVEEGKKAYKQLFDAWGYPILIQRHIPGEEFDVIALADRAHRLLGAVAMKKIGLTEKGKAFAGVTIANQTLIDLTADILKKLAWTGPAECEFIQDADGAYHLMEVNSRFPSWVYLAAAAGQNLPYLTVQAALGVPVSPMKDYRVGKLFIRTVTDRILDPRILTELAFAGEVSL